MFKTVLIAVDVSVPEDADRLLRAAKSLTEGWDATLHVVSVVPTVGMPIVGSFFGDDFERDSQSAAANLLETAVDKVELEAAQHVAMGKVYDCIIEKAGDLSADLILVGAHQPELSDFLLGSNAARVVRHSKASVLVLRG